MKRFLATVVIGLIALPVTSLADSKLGAELGAIDSLKPSVYQLKRRAEPTALRSLERFENDKNALLALARDNFQRTDLGRAWRGPRRSINCPSRSGVYSLRRMGRRGG